jgi:hypothetical protein
LFVVLCIATQGSHRDAGELGKVFLDAGSLFEEPF